MIKKLNHSLVKNLLNKTIKNYYKNHQTKLQLIAIFGSVGKSSQTKTIAQLFSNGGYKVLTTNKNTVNGIGMLLTSFETSFESRFGFFKKIQFLIVLIYHNIFFKLDLPYNSILVLEVGFDHQGEANDFLSLFSGILDIAIITALTDEHNLNYSDLLNIQDLQKIKEYLPQELANNLENNNLANSTKNVIIEMLKPIIEAKKSYIPRAINQLTNEIYIKTNKGTEELYNPEFEFKDNFLSIEGIKVDSNYLLPKTFAKTLGVLIALSKDFKINKTILEKTITSLDLPKGRFSKLSGKENTTIIDSSYNSDPDSVFGFLESIEEELFNQNDSEFNFVKHNIILGEMRELGNINKAKHCEVLDKLLILKANNKDKIENIILLGSSWAECDETGITKEDQGKFFITYNKVLFVQYLKVSKIVEFYNSNLRPHSWFWIKGSQNTIFLEVLVESLLANKEDKKLLCRQEKRWFEARKGW